MRNRILFLLGFVALAINGHSQTITDIDGNVYKTVRIGVQTWMAENLKTSRLNNGESIQKIEDSSKWTNSASAWCWYNNDSLYNNAYGALYNWPAIKTGKVCPVGWHVPTNNEWNFLPVYLGGVDIAGKKMKEADTSHWKSPNEFSDNSSNFTGLPGGFRNSAGDYSSIRESGYFWTATEFDTQYARYRLLQYDNSILNDSHEYEKGSGFSVRCVKDSTIIDTSMVFGTSPMVFGTWDKSGSPYIIKRNITIPDGAILNIEAGVKVVFSGYYSPTVIGSINCLGSASDSIIFTRNDTTGFYNNSDSIGGWAGIRFKDYGLDTSIFKYCKFEYGKAVTNSNPLGGIIWINQSICTNIFENCTFRYNKAQSGGAIYHYAFNSNQGRLSLVNCNFIQNYALDNGGAISACSWNQKNTIAGNKFIKNKANTGGGIYLYTGITNFKNNLFEGNSAAENGGAIYLAPSTEQSLINCIISNNYADKGAAISGPLGCYLNIYNSTFVNNNSPKSILYMGNMTATIISNTIFWNPGTTEISRNSTEDDITVKFSDIKDGKDSSWFDQTCIDTDPLFTYSNANPYFLSPNSPCIDAGSVDTSGLHLPQVDFYGNNRIFNQRIDIGAVENQSFFSSLKPKQDRDESLMIYPNPVINYVYFKNVNIQNIICRIKLLSLQGMAISTFESPTNNNLNLQSYSPGIYLLNFYFQDGHVITKKITKE